MSSLKQISSEISRFLCDEAPEAICISGEWGVGKTYTWDLLFNEAVSDGRVSKKKYSYASLFGICSLEALKMAIFENTYAIIDSRNSSNEMLEAKIAGNKIIEAAKRGRFLLTSVPFIGKSLSEAGPLFFSL